MDRTGMREQVSAGGVVFRRSDDGVQVVLISVGPLGRWQLPKELVEPGEQPQTAALREVREETGLAAELVEPLETIEYWFLAGPADQRVRYHKYVHFFLLRYLSGQVSDHDQEVNEARWFRIDEAETVLAFENERRVVNLARQRIEEQNL